LRGGQYLPDNQLTRTGSIVLLGTQPSRPRAFRTQVQPLVSSMTSTVSGSPAAVASSGVVRRKHDGGPGARIDVPAGHPSGSVFGGDEDEGRPGSVLAPNLDALADGYLDGPAAGNFMGFNRMHHSHLVSVAPHRCLLQTARRAAIKDFRGGSRLDETCLRPD
jgi:hypothetical protein